MNIVYYPYRHSTGFLTFSVLIALLSKLPVSAQDIVLQEVVRGKASVTSPTSVKMLPGFHAVEGSAFRAYIGPVQGTGSSFSVDALSSSAVPEKGSDDINYIKTITYREAHTSEPTSAFQHLEEITYFDGLGRPVQTVSVGAAPNGEDIIQPILYDEFGREAIKTLPYTAEKNGEFRSGVTEATVNAYYNAMSDEDGMIPDNRAFTQIDFDNSPLNRVVSQSGPGEDWETNSKNVTINYLSNAGESITGWNVDENDNFTSFL
jgi:hypothetical protein